MEKEAAYLPQYYGDLAVEVYAPQYYYDSHSNNHTHYSQQVVAGKHQDLSAYFFQQIKEVLVNLPIKPKDCIMVIVPSHEKGKYSPTLHSLALLLQKNFGIPYANVIERVKMGKKMTNCSGRTERFEQVNGAFKVTYSIKGFNVILLDDTKTTGLTILECTKELKNAGATDVIGLCLGINR